ncbi:MAG: hypothetical protein LBO71_02980 [Prevotellaceae bacterium]|jgi:hypothetical protein|nr:hypothetical protein [Prevotellaceae bacterium]
MIQTFIYLTPVIALVALLWSSKSWIKNFFVKKTTLAMLSEYDTVKNNPAVKFALSWKNPNCGKKQDEELFRSNGKAISASESYKQLRRKVFELV